jgi:hypothetical protein
MQDGGVVDTASEKGGTPTLMTICPDIVAFNLGV